MPIKNMNEIKRKNIIEFLSESNKIEGVYDKDSLDLALKAWTYLAPKRKLTKEVILQTHKLLMAHSELHKDQIGFFRRCPVWIGGREGADWTKVPELIDSWLLDVATSIEIPGEDGKHIKLDHIEYERIHGFCDGNGRTGRMFMNYQRIKAGLPIIIIHADWPDPDGEQASYYSWFR
jgi:Fic family protein